MTPTEKLHAQESRIYRMASYKYIELGELLLRHRYAPIADLLVGSAFLRVKGMPV
jgi:hypothetical protein